MSSGNTKLFVGNLTPETDEKALRALLDEHGIAVSTVLVKKGGFAFIDCDESTGAQDAIDKMNGLTINGKVIIVEYSVPKQRPGSRRSRTTKVQVRNIPVSVAWEAVQELVGTFGTVNQIDQVSKDEVNMTVSVNYQTTQQAQQAMSQLNGHEFEGATLKVVYIYDGPVRGPPRGGPRGNMGGRPPFGPGGPRNLPAPPQLPLRILVPADMVGAIIGKQGNTIREITKSSRARYIIIDVHGKGNSTALEKPITIHGSPESQSVAVRKISEVMEEEAKTNGKETDIALKILTHNSLVGRLIGKSGANLKKIMADSNTKIGISPFDSLQDLNMYSMERTITITGEKEDKFTAEKLVMTKLRQSYEKDMENLMQQQQNLHSMYPGLNHMQLFPNMNNGQFPLRTPYGSPMGYNNRGDEHMAGKEGPPAYMSGSHYPPATAIAALRGPPPTAHVPDPEITRLYVPNGAVGGLIGKKGQYIRHISRLSNASVKIAPSTNSDMREVLITGTPEAQWKAQYYIYDRVSKEGFGDPAFLTAEVAVPVSAVGRIIGKKGQAVRDLQAETNTVIDVPMGTQGNDNQDVMVKVSGLFYAGQSAQRKIRDIVAKHLSQQARQKAQEAI